MRKRLGGGYWRLGMPLGLMLGCGNPFRAECGLESSWGGGAPPPFKRSPVPPWRPACPNRGLPKHGDPVFPCFLGCFGTIICAVPISNPIEKVVCSHLQAAGRVNMGVRVLVLLQDHCSTGQP